MQIIVGVNPEYYKQGDSELDANPCAKIIFPAPKGRPKQRTKEILRRLTRVPEFATSERRLDASDRINMPYRLRGFFYPDEGCHPELYVRVRSAIMNGYRCPDRNPLTRNGQYCLHNAGRDGFSLNAANFPSYPPTISLVTGVPGSGKTAAMEVALNALGATVTQHSEFDKKPFTEVQILYLGIDTPPRATTLEFMKECCDRVNAIVLKVSDIAALKYGSSSRRGDFKRALKKAIANYHIGVIILDSAEHITSVGTTGVGELAALLANLRNELGVPIILLGTYTAEDEILKHSVATQQRICDGFHLYSRRPEGPEDKWFAELCAILWHYQWVRYPIKFGDEILETLYFYSQGIARILIDVFMSAQMAAIDSGSERVDAKLLKDIYDRNFKILHPSVNALRDGVEGNLRKFEGLFPKAYEDLRRTGKLPSAIGQVNADLAVKLRKKNNGR